MLNRNISHDIWSWNRFSPLPVTIRTPRSFLLSYHIKYDISRQTIKESKIKSNVRETWLVILGSEAEVFTSEIRIQPWSGIIHWQKPSKLRHDLRFLHIIIFRVRNPYLTDSSFPINICDVGARGQKPASGLLAGGFLTLIPAQTCVSSYFSSFNTPCRCGTS